MARKPQTYSDMNPGRFLPPDKLLKKDVTLTIKEFVFEKMNEGKNEEERCIMYFKETKLGMKVNKTNQVCLQAMFGGTPEDAIGKKITLMHSTARFGREVHPCIRLRGSPELEKPVVASIKRFGGKTDEYKLINTK